VLKEFFPFINPLYLPICEDKRPVSHLRNRSDSTDGKAEPDIYFDYNEHNPDETKENNTNIYLGKKRRKFDYIYDYLLMLGLTFHGKKNIDLVQRLWLDTKSISEIKHRIKNLTCMKAPNNVIKAQKFLSEVGLTKVSPNVTF
jgi:hypothetical protein